MNVLVIEDDRRIADFLQRGFACGGNARQDDRKRA